MNALRQLEWALLELQQSTPLASVSGAISEIAPTHFRVSGLSRFVRLGELIGVNSAGKRQIGEVVRIDSDGIVAKPFDRQFAGGLGSVAYRMPPLSFAPDPSWKGRVINALGAPLDGQGPLIQGPQAVSAEAEAPSAMKRARVHKPLRTGVRVIDLFSPICAGQRVGIFAGSGVGKSTLLAMLARSQGFDTVVLALVGERGREVREFIEDVLGTDRHRAVTIVSTGDESPMMRRLAPKTAMAVAEYFRDRGESVLLMVDSITRFAHAAREVALAAGEPAVARAATHRRSSPICRVSWSAPVQARRDPARLPGFSPCWSMATITTSRSPTPSAARLMGTSCSPGTSPTRRAIRPSMFWRRFHASPITSGTPRSANW
ncbi:flagellar biosynthesis/type III secretory pathway ATPase [Bradyrhizobium liaoningense]